jgi:prepilin-type N-terminal cleavage/methylation domain-containing protein
MRKRGFTLIELLVVIAIIGVVMSLVMPSLTAMRARAMFVACRSNLNQIGIALHEYVYDYDSLPVIAAIDKVKDKKEDPANGFPSLAEALYEYVETDRIFSCAVDRGLPSAKSNINNGVGSCFNKWGSSFDFNSDMYYTAKISGAKWYKSNGKPKPVTAAYLSTVRLTAESILMHDYTGDYFEVRWHKISQSPTYNVMFLDLHVEGMTIKDGQSGLHKFDRMKEWWENGHP